MRATKAGEWVASGEGSGEEEEGEGEVASPGDVGAE